MENINNFGHCDKEETMNVDGNDTETARSQHSPSPKAVVDDIMSEIFTTVCERIDTRSTVCSVQSLENEDHSAKEVVDEIVSELFYTVCERIENNLNDKYTKQSTNQQVIDSVIPMEMNNSNTTKSNNVVMIKKGSLVPYEDSSGSGTEDSESDSELTSSESESTVSSEQFDSDDSGDDQVETGNGQLTKPSFKPIKTRGEFGLDDLPQIEHLQISAEGCKLELIGLVSGIVDTLVVVHTLHGTSTLDIDSHLFAEDGSSLGQIFDVFGNTQNPYYSIRYNNVQEIEEKNIKIGDKVYYAPEKIDLYSTIFAEDIKKQSKGSDASWEYNNEPPDQFLDYSDDESERMAKRKSKSKRTSNGSQKIMHKRQKWQQPYTPRGSNSYPILRHPVFRPHFQHPSAFPSFSNASLPIPQFPNPGPFLTIRPYGEGFGQMRLPSPNFNFFLSSAPPPPPPLPSSSQSRPL